MQVDSSGSISNLVRKAHDGQSPQKPGSDQSLNASATGSTDNVTITSAAAQLHEIEQHIKQAPATDAAHIEQVQSALKAGRYAPDPSQVAGKIMSFETALNSVRH